MRKINEYYRQTTRIYNPTEKSTGEYPPLFRKNLKGELPTPFFRKKFLIDSNRFQCTEYGKIYRSEKFHTYAEILGFQKKGRSPPLFSKKFF